jgi:hypothetical protein
LATLNNSRSILRPDKKAAPEEAAQVVLLTCGYLPVPDKATFCGLPTALSEILSAAERAPVAVGVKVTLTVQLESAANELPHVVAD